MKKGWIQFDRNELAGSFGDLGTSLPLILAMIPAASLDVPSVFITFGAAQIVSGIVYGLPMPLQPLKAMAVLVISQRLGGDILYGGGLAIGISMLLLTVSGGLSWLARVIPISVVRGIQFGLGLSLMSLALKTYVPEGGATGYSLAAAGFLATIFLWGNRRVPAALVVVGLGLGYTLLTQWFSISRNVGPGFGLPQVHLPRVSDVWVGFWLLALPQLPLSFSNSVVATHHTLRDLFPARKIALEKIGFTYSLFNLVMPFFKGIPVCHGCGGLAGHHNFGARTGGSVVFYGALFVLMGGIFGQSAGALMQLFPKSILGVILLFEAIALMRLLADVAASSRDFPIALIVGAMAYGLPQGFAVGMVAGVGLDWLARRYGVLKG